MYEWVKAFHVMSVIAWMAGLFYLPRLFVYHCDAEAGSAQSETFKIMERRLFRAIMTPAMASSWIFGLWLVLGFVGFDEAWLHVKIAAVVAMTAFHEFCGRWVRAFAADGNTRPARFYRLVNEIPTLLMIVIVVMVIVRPF